MRALRTESDAAVDSVTPAQPARVVDGRAEGAAATVCADDVAVAGDAALDDAAVPGDAAAGDAAQDTSSYHMYVVRCADGSLYTGYAIDVERRVAQHNAGRGAKYTRSRRPVRLLAAARFATQHEALAAEYRFKRIPRARKVQLVERARALAEEGTGSKTDSHVEESAFAQVLHETFDLTGAVGANESQPDAAKADEEQGELTLYVRGEAGIRRLKPLSVTKANGDYWRGRWAPTSLMLSRYGEALSAHTPHMLDNVLE